MSAKNADVRFLREMARNSPQAYWAKDVRTAADDIERLRNDLAAALAMLMRLTAIAGDANERFFGEPRAGSSQSAATPDLSPGLKDRGFQ